MAWGTWDRGNMGQTERVTGRNVGQGEYVDGGTCDNGRVWLGERGAGVTYG